MRSRRLPWLRVVELCPRIAFQTATRVASPLRQHRLPDAREEWPEKATRTGLLQFHQDASEAERLGLGSGPDRIGGLRLCDQVCATAARRRSFERPRQRISETTAQTPVPGRSLFLASETLLPPSKASASPGPTPHRSHQNG